VERAAKAHLAVRALYDAFCAEYHLDVTFMCCEVARQLDPSERQRLQCACTMKLVKRENGYPSDNDEAARADED
jgi:hypothetical protein